MKQTKQQLNIKQGGFTLVETLVAVSIFSISILGLVVVLTQGVTDTGYAKKKITAGFLAQEGIEYVRNMRDTFVVYNSDPDQGWSEFETYLNACAGADGCYFGDLVAADYGDQAGPIKGLSIVACSGACSPLLYNEANGKYGYESGVNSGFIRRIKITKDPAYPNELKISSAVFWNQGSGTYNIELTENLYNWIE